MLTWITEKKWPWYCPPRPWKCRGIAFRYSLSKPLSVTLAPKWLNSKIEIKAVSCKNTVSHCERGLCWVTNFSWEISFLFHHFLFLDQEMIIYWFTDLLIWISWKYLNMLFVSAQWVMVVSHWCWITRQWCWTTRQLIHTLLGWHRPIPCTVPLWILTLHSSHRLVIILHSILHTTLPRYTEDLPCCLHQGNYLQINNQSLQVLHFRSHPEWITWLSNGRDQHGEELWSVWLGTGSSMFQICKLVGRMQTSIECTVWIGLKDGLVTTWFTRIVTIFSKYEIGLFQWP